jgi:adenine C2-methylase RlmN of 23S rRNA A2503 and tRNA A37
MTIIDIGYILLDNINSKNDLNKIKLIEAIERYNKEINEKNKLEIYNKNKYETNYENKRKDNIDNYNQYLRENKILYDKWIKSKKTKDLYEYISLKKPEYEEVDDIYTFNPISLR